MSGYTLNLSLQFFIIKSCCLAFLYFSILLASCSVVIVSKKNCFIFMTSIAFCRALSIESIDVHHVISNVEFQTRVLRFLNLDLSPTSFACFIAPPISAVSLF